MLAGDVLSLHIKPTDFMLATDALIDEILALSLALSRLTKMMEASMPIIAMTIKSSIRVKPLDFDKSLKEEYFVNWLFFVFIF